MSTIPSRRQLLWLSTWIVVGVMTLQHDAFSNADTNLNNVLERSEFQAYIASLSTALRPFLVFEDQDDDDNDDDDAATTAAKAKAAAKANAVKAAHPRAPSDHDLTLTKSHAAGFWSGFMSGIVTIWATEIGDKTFFIAAILSMRHDRLIVFSGAMGALIVMTVLSVALGGIVGHFLPKELTHYAGTLLFLVFGMRMLYDARAMDADKPSEELAEVEEALEDKKRLSVSELEGGEGEGDGALGDATTPHHHNTNTNTTTTTTSQAQEQTMAMLNVLSQGFVMTFLAEWGDRSQIATITLSTSKSAVGVTLGAILGHSMCTGLAVLGGKMLASRISERTITRIGGVLFLLFGAHSAIVGPNA